MGTRGELGFIDGSCKRPDETTDEFTRWTRCDNMVTCWILNSLISEISESFIYIETSKELWDEIAERYGQTNGPLIYQLKRELTVLMQENSTIVVYFNKMKRIWDELQSVDPTPQCNCAAMKEYKCDLLKRIQELETRNHLMQFLMGLNTNYDQTRGQILAMDPLPSVSRAYYILQQLEKQHQVTEGTHVRNDAEAFVVTKSSVKLGNNSTRKDHKKNKSDRFCDHYKVKGHTMENCFKIHGYPDWYKGDKTKGTPRLATQVIQDQASIEITYNMPLDFDDHGKSESKLDPALLNIVCQEVIKALQSEGVGSSSSSVSTELTAAINFAGKSYFPQALSNNTSPVNPYLVDGWIIDSGAADYISPHIELFVNIRSMSKPIMIGLPDGRIEEVTMVGDIILNPNIIPKGVLHIPAFQYNLLSVGKLLDTSNLATHFTKSGCVFQDLITKVKVADAHRLGGLYKLNKDFAGRMLSPSL